MATEASTDDDELRDISCIFGIFDTGVEDILAKIDTVSREEIEHELTENFDKELLRNLRLKCFELAKEKAKRSAVDNRGDRNYADALAGDQADQWNSLTQCIDQWETVKRRAKHKIVNDALGFLLYVIDPNATFPPNVIRSASTDNFTLEEEEISEDLTEQFCREVSKAVTPVEVEVIHSEANREKHVITLPAVQVIDLRPIEGHLDIETDSVYEQKGNSPKGASGGDTTPVDCPSEPPTVEESGEERGKGNCINNTKPISLPCTLCGHSLQSVSIGQAGKKDTGTSADDFRDYLKRMNDLERETPVSREEYEYHTDYIEQLAQEAVKKNKDIEVWQRRVEERVLRLERNQVRKDDRVL